MSLSNGAQTAIGVLISLTASSIDAIGLNLQRRDHIRNSALPPEDQKIVWRRPVWILGFVLYVGSQLFGSTAALNFLQPAVVAPLGSITLIFNLMFSAVLVGTKIRRMDIVGTFLVILAATLIAIFGQMPKSTLSLEKLLALYQRPQFIAYFSALISIALLLIVASYVVEHIALNEQRRANSVFKKIEDEDKLKRLCGALFAMSGGVVASFTVLLAETGVRLLSTTLQGSNQFKGATAWIILLILLVSCITQVVCLNSGLRICDAIVVVPVFFTFYSVLALFNQNMYYDIWDQYNALNYGMLITNMFILSAGVYLLTISQKTAAPSLDEEETIDAPITNEDAGGPPDSHNKNKDIVPSTTDTTQVTTPETRTPDARTGTPGSNQEDTEDNMEKFELIELGANTNK